MNGLDLMLLILGVLAVRFAYAAGRMRERHEQTMRAPSFEQPQHVAVKPQYGPRYVYDVERDGL